MMRFLLVTFSLTILGVGGAHAQRILDPRDPAAVSGYIRAQGLACPATAKVKKIGFTNRGSLYLVDCPAKDGKGLWRYQMILSPDQSHVTLYRCAASGKCPIGARP
ncbi:MAG: hypothetical protein ACTSUD_02015 [Alphaproteobacteria bacterium]